MGSTTARAMVSDYNNFCIQSGLDPAVILNYTGIIQSFGGVAGFGRVAEWGAAPSHATNLETLQIPWDCLIVGASVRYINGQGDCTSVLGALQINCVSATASGSGGAGRSSAATMAAGTSQTMIALSNAEIKSVTFQKTETGLALPLSGGTQLFVASLCVTNDVDGAVATSDLAVSIQIAVPQSKLGLPTTQS